MTPQYLCRFLATLVLLAMLPLVSQAQQVLIPSPPQINGTSYVLMDPASGRIIMEANSDERLPPASLTKMMTAYIVERELDEGRLSLDEMVPISVKAWQTGGSRMFIQEGSTVSVEELLKGVIIQSGNDASVALAEHVAGSEGAFADVMNQQAQLIGMENTRFETATGLPHENQYSTAYDLALLAAAIINDYPENYPLYAEKHFTYNNIRQPNRNSLLWRDPSVDGLKTGHTEEAGYCLVASAERENTRLIAVVMGTDSSEARAREVQKMLNYGFRYYETARLFDSGESLLESRVWKGEQDQLNLGLASDMVLTIPRGARDSLESVVEVDSVIEAPVSAGDELGTVTISFDGKVLAERPLVAIEPVPEGGFFKRLIDAVKLFFHNLFN
ncbi:D-alanyl-D-alanine carboxypeptidase family protein [Marinobacter sp. M1N3S26]|uniref:D-alanyl-D-alanine carboxypeptidase family protein n=1 Tax=unclassified Marinobacter TaxID=83889 RepID=UPI00387AE63B